MSRLIDIWISPRVGHSEPVNGLVGESLDDRHEKNRGRLIKKNRYWCFRRKRFGDQSVTTGNMLSAHYSSLKVQNAPELLCGGLLKL
jgi:hypothetical protein